MNLSPDFGASHPRTFPLIWRKINMSLPDELQRLADLRSSGALTESEFEQAKAKLLNEELVPRGQQPDDRRDDSLGRAANRYVTFQFIMAVIAILVFLFVIAPRMVALPDRHSVPQCHFRQDEFQERNKMRWQSPLAPLLAMSSRNFNLVQRTNKKI